MSSNLDTVLYLLLSVSLLLFVCRSFCSFDVPAVAAVVVATGSLVVVQKVTRNCWDKREKLESMIISAKM